MLDALPIWILIAILGLAIGVALGFVARWTRFCTLSALETALLGDNWLQLRMWVMAIGVAILGTSLLVYFELIDLGETVHYLPRFAIAGPVLGGLLFGLGMAAVGTCGFGSVLRAGGGDLRGLVTVLVIGVTGYATIRGFLAIPRLTLVEPISIPLAEGENATLPSLIAKATGLAVGDLAFPVALITAATILVWCLSSRSFRHSVPMLTGGTVVGLLVVAGWFVTGYLGNDEFDPQPVESLSFVSATGDTMIYLMTYTGSTVGFGVGLFFGTLVGSFLAALFKSELRLEGFDETREMRRHIGGAVLMGVGGVLSMGCSVGQGLTGVSTLALPSFLALFSMWAGAAIGLHILIHGWTFSSEA